MKTWDVIIVGGGLIGLSIALALRKHGAQVLVVERGAAGREASHAAAGMLAHCDPHLSDALRPLAFASARMYPAFVAELEGESGELVDYRKEGTILLPEERLDRLCPHSQPLSADDVAQLEPGLRIGDACAVYLPEASVDPRALLSAALKLAKQRGIELARGAEVTEIESTNSRIIGVRTERTHFAASSVVNCGGAWAGEISPLWFPTRPIKGQMLARSVAVVHDEQGSPSSPRLLRHVVRASSVYLVPRGDGRILIGSTLEDVGFDKRVDADTVQRLDDHARALLPELAQARMVESWAGLRPASPDHLPIMGETAISGYYVATGHYRDGILLAPITAQLMVRIIQGLPTELDISAFSTSRFE